MDITISTSAADDKLDAPLEAFNFRSVNRVRHGQNQHAHAREAPLKEAKKYAARRAELKS